MRQRPLLVWILVMVIGAMVTLVACSEAEEQSKNTGRDKITLRILTHWGDGGDAPYASKIKPYLDEYMRLHPNVEIKYESVDFGNLLSTFQTQFTAGNAPDIVHLYSLWGVQLSRTGMLAPVPDKIAQQIKEQWVNVARDGVTVDGKFIGIPTEIDTYALIYNKRLLEEAGIRKPPSTWDEFYATAKAIARKKRDGSLERAGATFMRGWDSAVVHPFMALMYSNGGEFVTPDLSQVRFNESAGVEALEFQVRLFREGITNDYFSQNMWTEFPAGNIGMIIMAPFGESWLRGAVGDRLDDFGVAPLPYKKRRASVAYTWFWGVTSQSKHPEEAWEFLAWLNGARSEDAGKTSRMGDFLVTVGIVPSRQADLDGHPAELNDEFTRPFIEALEYAHAEPMLPQGQEIKTILMREIEAAWAGQKSPQEALNAAAEEANRILQEAR